ncbi:hypothetical protein MKW98_027714, partial [Papaver atlanticum]
VLLSWIFHDTQRRISRENLVCRPFSGRFFYLSELPEFSSRESSLIIKDIFGVTEEDAITLRTHTLSEAGMWSHYRRCLEIRILKNPVKD